MTTLFVATTGGHLAELNGLAARVRTVDDTIWVTHDNEQSRSVLAGRDVEYVPYVGVRDVRDVLRCLPHAGRLRRRGVTRAFSTGSGIALGYLPYLAARGVECHYVESACRVAGPSLTGRVLQYVPGVRCYTQYPAWADRRWTYGGNEFDRFERAPGEREPGAVVRVVVTVGTAREFPFRRLVDALRPLLAPGGALARATGRPVEVLWQTGCTPAPDLPTSPFLPPDELAAAHRSADVVVCHAGLGSVLAALDAGRRPVVAVRRRAFGEAGDDHQSELAAEVERRGLGVAREAGAIELDDLLGALRARVASVAHPSPFVLS
jgi:UDP-N-acetylglucosamine--N-acetylmuramyl-(pentapeptide) pyrophosphoryl-undecaprenol N-acetylglucosamine transferase